jgi:hypothetical protein
MTIYRSQNDQSPKAAIAQTASRAKVAGAAFMRHTDEINAAKRVEQEGRRPGDHGP